MKTVSVLIKRNIKLFFKDKGMFFTSLITPVILLVLYATFLGNVYRDSLVSAVGASFTLPESVLNGLVGGELISSILAVSCVTVAFCSNFLMVQDKVTGALKDFRVSPIKPSALSFAYYFANLITTLLICFAAAVICLLYVASVGWYLSVTDVLLVFADVVLLVLFGNALSSVINFFLHSQGQISAVGTIVSSGYGFICGAYMPLSSFGEGLRNVLSFLPGTYGTSLLRNHAMSGALAELQNCGVPELAAEGVKDALDCNLYFFGNAVPQWTMYAILCGSTAVLLIAYVLLNVGSSKRCK